MTETSEWTLAPGLKGTIKLDSPNHENIAVIERDKGTRCVPDLVSGDSKLYFHGYLIDCATGAELDSTELAQRLRDGGSKALLSVDGAFVGIWYDSLRDSWCLFNDRLGILPMFWQVSGLMLSIGPHGDDLEPRPRSIDVNGLISFLTLGYCLGSRTLREGVRRLGPASFIVFSGDGRQPDMSPYWNLAYRPNARQSSKEHAAILHGEIARAVREHSSYSTRSGIFLSGGWDCRAILGAQLRTGSPPSLVVTNGSHDHVPGTDTALARRLSYDHDLSYRFCRRLPELALHHAFEGIQRCDLATDNAPEVFGQHHTQDGMFRDVDFVFKGDEIWGWGDAAFDRQSAVGQVMPTHTPKSLSKLLNPDVYSAAEQIYQHEVDTILSRSQGNTWNEHKDYLYCMGRVSRYIFGLGASDEWHVQVRRPLLSHNVISAVAQLPDNFRVRKNLFVEMLARHEPQLYSYRSSHVSHIADYYSVMQDVVRARIRSLMAEGQDIGRSINPAGLLDLVSRFSSSPSPMHRISYPKRLRNNLVDRWGWRWNRTAAYQHHSRKFSRPWSASEVRVLFRVWLVLEYASRL